MQGKPLLTATSEINCESSINVKISPHGFSEAARKLFAMAITVLPKDLSSLNADFTFSDFYKAAGMSKCENTYKILKAAIDECMGCIITIENEPNEESIQSWEMYKWITYTKYDEGNEEGTITFHSPLAEFLTAIKLMYSKTKLTDISQLQNRHASRIFELAMINMSVNTAIKNNIENKLGNKSIFEKTKQGRQLTIIAFDCKKPRKRRSKEPIPEPTPIVEVSNEEYLDYLKYLYPKEFNELYKKAFANFFPYIADDIKQLAAEGSALLQLKERYGINK